MVQVFLKGGGGGGGGGGGAGTVHNFIKKSHSKLSKNEPKNIP